MGDHQMFDFSDLLEYLRAAGVITALTLFMAVVFPLWLISLPYRRIKGRHGRKRA